MSTSSCFKDTQFLNYHPLLLIHCLRHPPLLLCASLETLDDFTDDLGDLGRSQMPVHGGVGMKTWFTLLLCSD
jgi:hypothetical protein